VGTIRHAGCDGSKLLWVSVSNQVPENAIVIPDHLSSVSNAELFSEYRVVRSKIVHRSSSPRCVAVISVFGINCGIATYTKYLCDALKLEVDELLVLAEDADIGNDEGLGYEVHRCWDRRSGDFLRLYKRLEEFSPELVIIQHEFGLFPKLNVWNTLISQLSRWRTAVTLHTVLEHDVSNKTIHLDYLTRFLAEAPCRELIVHTPRARQTIRARGFSGRIHYIPHGCFPPNPLERLPITKYGMMPNQVLFQYGFGSPHKGWDFAIDTVSLLVEKYPDIIYIGIFNVSSSNRNAAYFHSLLNVIREKKLEKNVAIHRGFQSEETLRLYLRSSRIAFFPYRAPNQFWASWGASGAIQLPLSMGIPTILSDFSAFQEFNDRLPIIRTPEEAASVIDRILSDPAYEKSLSDTAFEIAEERRWEKVAAWYLEITEEEDFNAKVKEAT